MIQKKYTKGFTLVELLVVIAIIAILAGALFMVINPAALMAKSRDAKRIAELDELNKAIAMAIAGEKITAITTVNTPRETSGATNTSCTGTTAVNGTGWVKFTGTLSTYYPTRLPVDPTNTGTRCYWFGGDGTDNTWELKAQLESADYTSKMSNDGGNEDGEYEVGTKLTISGP